MSDLREIGFYTLSDDRAKNVSTCPPLQRCELILTDRCNFQCPYCRGLRDDIKGTMPFDQAIQVIDSWADDGLVNIRLSGGEPTIYPRILDLVGHARARGIQRIAMSTNGSASNEMYRSLVDAGINDFSISLDACCASDADKMAGKQGYFEHVSTMIQLCSHLTYTTVGVVVSAETVSHLSETIMFAHSLGVADIRVISAAQETGTFLDQLQEQFDLVPEILFDFHPILRYRFANLLEGHEMRGLKVDDCHQCHLVLDDMAVAGGYHFPCIIYMREQGDPIGKVGPHMRFERVNWCNNHNTLTDPICSANCLDVCVDYNNRVQMYLDEA